jgi:hypothetical protein
LIARGTFGNRPIAVKVGLAFVWAEPSDRLATPRARRRKKTLATPVHFLF